MSITVSDPFGAIADRELPTLALALDPETARHEFKRRLPRLSADGKLRLKAIRVMRHKPGRRCVVEYDVEVDRPGTPRHLVTVIGKVRARRSGNEAFRVQEAFWDAGFDSRSADGVSVPEPLGVISNLQMWFQRKVAGVGAEFLLADPNGAQLARHIAEGVHKLHEAAVPTEKKHGLPEELDILRNCFGKLATLRPGLRCRVQDLMTQCERLATHVPASVPRGIHRDFYPSQLVLDGARLWVLDFDLYCLGDPALDVGNLIGHVTEQALREHGRPDALADVERSFENRYIELAGEAVRPGVHAYTILTLARHVYLSTQFPNRNHLTEQLVALCEKRLGAG